MTKTAFLSGDIYIAHDTGWGHPECPDRLKHIYQKVKSSSYYKALLKVEPCDALYNAIEEIHPASYIERVKRDIESGDQYLDSMDTVICRDSFNIALKAVGGSLALCDKIMKGEAQNGFCAVRPPGHHAEYDSAMGFCIFNNIAIAARHFQKNYGIERVAIVDWDVHHGNGTQHSFYKDDSVLFISTHQMPLFPGTGAPREKGSGKGEGYTINIPLTPGNGDREMQSAFDERILPALDSFKPQVLLMSAGFDAHKADPIAALNLTTEMYYKMAVMLKEIAEKHCDGRMVAFLEGGYNLSALANSVDRVMQAFIE